MNIGSFSVNSVPNFGLFENATAYGVSREFRKRFADLKSVLEAGALDQMIEDATSGEKYPTAEITFLPPIPNPNKIICVGMNYRKPYPVEGVAPPDPQNIILFGKENITMVGHGQSLEMPHGEAGASFDFEGEIAAIIGKHGRHILVEEALDYVLGYSAFNDGSVREWQKHSVYAGKNFAHSGGWGPWITLADALPAPEALELSVTLNDEVMQSAKGDEMIFSLAQQISYASHLFALCPGDVIATGSPNGTGASQKPPRFLRQHDRLDVTVLGVGTVSNTVA